MEKNYSSILLGPLALAFTGIYASSPRIAEYFSDKPSGDWLYLGITLGMGLMASSMIIDAERLIKKDKLEDRVNE